MLLILPLPLPLWKNTEILRKPMPKTKHITLLTINQFYGENFPIKNLKDDTGQCNYFYEHECGCVVSLTLGIPFSTTRDGDNKEFSVE